ncbi:SGNH/GDSL hydrolase family protein [Acidobacterium sp. S8]|uniref:SGNH/GDSL hydrolase family protein n=1 Tax=Acidobacterium sp. S8 TaxID=1641854 RepID=UPI0020B10672|nr:SGNH/GDSL hydrolase family protein [Acidobacterium sp. S8]
MRKSACFFLMGILSSGTICSAQTQQTNSASSDDPAAQAVLSLEHWRESRIPTFMSDFGELNRYRAANDQLKSAAPQANRVIFFGDSITDAWKLDRYFPDKGYINRGIGGQTTPQMLIRFRQDVIDLAPKVVVILAGTNDIAGNTGPMTVEETEANLTSLAELARAHSIRVVLASVTPIHNYFPERLNMFLQRSPEKIRQVNQWMQNYCAQNNLVYLDYFGAMVDDHGMMKQELADDGLHPNDSGYHVMAPLAEKAIAKALAQ